MNVWNLSYVRIGGKVARISYLEYQDFNNASGNNKTQGSKTEPKQHYSLGTTEVTKEKILQGQ